MMEHLTGLEGILWDVSPAMALVLLASVPSGDPQIARVRNDLLAIMPMPNEPNTGYCLPPIVRHIGGDFHKYSSPLIYVGFGPSDIQSRPSQYANPYYFTSTDPDEALCLYREYLDCRADLAQFLEPLRGAELICDCKLGSYCHTSVLIEYVDKVQQCVVIPDDSKLDAMSEACVMEGFEEDNDDDMEIAPAPRFNVDVAAVNETVRSGAANLHQERPSWLPSWVNLIVVIRTAIAPVFWDIFSGKVGLTR